MAPTSGAHAQAIRAETRLRDLVHSVAPTRMEAFLTIAGDIATVLTAGALLSLGDAYTTREATWCLDQQTVFADVGQAMWCEALYSGIGTRFARRGKSRGRPPCVF